MAVRPVFIVGKENERILRKDIEFKYFSGFALSQQQKNIESLHTSFYKEYLFEPLEISTKATEKLGIALSAFNLKIETKQGNKITVEALFQGSKVFENGGPYTDLLNLEPHKIKKDLRLKNSGLIVGFRYKNKEYSITPRTAYYNWTYINALHLNPDLAKEVVTYGAFTDIMFNPKKALNCQAEAVAIYVTLYKYQLLDKALESYEKFIEVVYYKNNSFKNERNIREQQIRLF